MAVVSELPVVVVLQDQPAGGTRPVDGRRAPVRAQFDPRRVLMRRCHQHRADSTQSRQIVGARATFVDVEGRGAQAGAGQQVAIEVEAVRLDGDRPYPPRSECLRHQHQTVVETGADDDPFRRGVHPAGPRQIVREHGAQLYPAEGVAVAEGVVRRRGQRAAGRGEPLRAGKLREVRPARQQAVRGTARGRPRSGSGAPGRARLGPPGHPGPGALLGDEPALGDQLGVGVGHGVTGDAKIGGQRPGRRQPGAGHQTPRAHGLPQGIHEPGAQPPGPVRSRCRSIPILDPWAAAEVAQEFVIEMDHTSRPLDA